MFSGLHVGLVNDWCICQPRSCGVTISQPGRGATDGNGEKGGREREGERERKSEAQRYEVLSRGRREKKIKQGEKNSSA